MASSEEDDYMADIFVIKAEKIRPGLDKPTRLKRELDLAKKRELTNITGKTKPVVQREHEHRQSGLQQAIPVENKGFAMLQKMGYKAGTGLGKLASGRVEPIPVQFKTGRSGLGRDADQKRKKEMVEQYREVIHMKKVKWAEENRENYRERMSGKYQDKGMEDPENSWYWPDYMLPKTDDGAEEEETEVDSDDDEDVEDQISEQEKLTQLTFYLRSIHRYCIWCGTSFNDADDLLSNCPGDTADAHGE